MDTRISTLLYKQDTSPTPRRVSLLRIGVQVVDFVVSVVLSVFAVTFFTWLNGKQHEFDQLQDKRK
jgi:hypothetical protein